MTIESHQDLIEGQQSKDTLKSRKGSRKGKRVVVYRPETETVEILKREQIDPEKYEELRIPRRKHVSLFVERAGKDSREARVKTEDEGRQDQDVFLARLNFDNLALKNRTRFFFGQLSTLYVSSYQGDKRSAQSMWGAQ